MQVEQDFPIPIYNVPISSLPFMPRPKRLELRRENKDLPVYIFMDSHEKKIFFKRKWKEYERKLNKTTAKQNKTKKMVKFQEEYDVRVYCEEEETECVAKAESFKDTYGFQHYHY
jgi:hypothetical protein